MLTNIASYEGTHEFDFTISDPERNIILIGGAKTAPEKLLYLKLFNWHYTAPSTLIIRECIMPIF